MTVYFLRAEGVGHIKIGSTSRRVGCRVKDLLTACPVPLTVLAAIEGGVGLERQLQRQFAHARVPDAGSEWFKPVPELLAYIAEASTTKPVAPEDEEVWCFVDTWKDPFTGYVWEMWVEERQRAGKGRGAAWMSREATKQELANFDRYAPLNKYLWQLERGKWKRPKVTLPKQ